MRRVPDLISIGGITVDYVQTTSGLSGPDVGGNALYAAVGGWLVGSHPTILANVGRDFPGELFDELSSLGFDMHLVGKVQGPSIKVVLDDSSGVRIQRYLPGSGDNATLDPRAESLPAISGNAAHVCGVPVSTQRQFLPALWGRAAVTTFDTVVIPGHIEPLVGQIEELMDCCDVYLPSIEEVAALWSVGDVVHWLRGQAKRGRSVVVKAGARGAITVTPEGDLLRMKAVPARVVDTTGAGDTYGGAFATMLACYGDVRIAMAWAAAAASVTIEGYGALHAVRQDRRNQTKRRALQLLNENDSFGEGDD